MIGRELKAGREIRESAAGDIALSLKDVCLHKKHSTKMSLDHVSLTIRRGEKELAEVITGQRRRNCPPA